MPDNFAWCLTRSSALVGYLLLWISIFLGLAIRTPILNKIIKPIYSFRVHCWISLQALIFALIHGVSLLGDRFISLNWSNIFIPFLSSSYSDAIDGNMLALGIIGFYIMIILVATSYLRKYIPQPVWRGIHFLNIGLFAIVFIHALYMGTDMKNDTVRGIFIIANSFLVFLYIINLFSRILKSFKRDEIVY